MSLSEMIRDHEKRLKLVDLQARESVGGWQALAKYADRITGPWGIGCDTDMAVAMEKALVAGEEVMKSDPPRNQVEWTPALRLPIIPKVAADLFDDILG